jgi:lipoic acid synthetase
MGRRTLNESPDAGHLEIRWLGRVDYTDAHAVQQGLFRRGQRNHLLLVEHPHVYTLGVRADPTHMLVDPAAVGATLVQTDRGGDITYHGPGQMVGYPVLNVAGKRGGGMADTAAYVHGVEQLLIDVLEDLGLAGAGRLAGAPGVWVGTDGDAPRKLAAIGVRLSRGRSMHGFALNVDPDLAYFDHIVPCGIDDKGVTSLRAEGLEVTLNDVADAIAVRAADRWGAGAARRLDVAWRRQPEDLAPFSRGAGPGPASPPDRSDSVPVRLKGRLAEAGVTGGIPIDERKPEWMKARLRIDGEYLRLKRVMTELDLVTVCEEAGCPNIFECWSDGTATFMINGDRCTRACGFCLVDTRKPLGVDLDEPARVAAAVETMDLQFAVVTAVARDDLSDGGAAGFVATITAIRRRCPATSVEVLIPDFKGSARALQTVFDAGPDVLNHNIETVPRLQRAVRPSAAYARSLSVLARSADAGLTTKSGLIVGMGESFDEVVGTMVDLRDVGVSIITVGQYLRPTSNHLPVSRWWEPTEFEELAEIGESLGLGHVEAGPFTRSSYHAREAAAVGVGAR